MNSVAYITAEMLHYFDPIIAKQLRDCAKNVFEKRETFFVTEMFSCELKFFIEICKKRFAKKIGSRFRELDLFTKQRYRRQNPIKWGKINVLSAISTSPFAVRKDGKKREMAYYDFGIKGEHSFIRNVFFFYQGFLSRTFTIHRPAGEGGGYFFKSSLPLPSASQTLRH